LWEGASAWHIALFCLDQGCQRFEFFTISIFIYFVIQSKICFLLLFCIQFLVRLLFFAVAILVAKTSYRLLLPDLKQRLSGHLGAYRFVGIPYVIIK
jgi:hypothetical protein